MLMLYATSSTNFLKSKFQEEANAPCHINNFTMHRVAYCKNLAFSDTITTILSGLRQFLNSLFCLYSLRHYDGFYGS